jgi:hypothetical protein
VTAERPARAIQTIVCAFTRAELPMDVAQVHRRFEHAVKKGGWAIRVRLEPIEQLPERYEVLVVPPELRERALAIESDAMLVVAGRQNAAAAVEQLLREIERGDILTAARADPNAPKIVTHRGTEIL